MTGPGPGHHLNVLNTNVMKPLYLLHGLVVGGVPVPSEGGDPAPVVELDVPMDAAGGQVVGQQAVVRGAPHHHLDNDFISSILSSVSADLTFMQWIRFC